MLQFIKRLFNSSDFMPHGHCYFWRPEILWLHVISDGLTALAYFSIPLTLVYLARKRRDLPFPWLFALFGLFIVACGTTHVLSIVTVWTPIYRIDGIAKAVTALASIGTALALIPMIPEILGLVGPDKLLAANKLLEEEIAWRKKTGARLDAQNDVAQIAAEKVCLQEAAPLFLKSICERLGWQIGELWTVDPSAGVMRLANGWHQQESSSVESALSTEFLAASHDWTFAKGQGLPGDIWGKGSPAWEHPRAGGGCIFQAAAQKAGLGRVVAFPLGSCEQDLLCTVMVFLSREQGAPDPELVVVMNTLAAQIAQFTERCRAETGLRASQARFSAFMEDAPALVYMKDEEGRFLYGNRTLLHHFGLRSEEYLGKTDFDFWPEVTPALREVDAKVLASGNAVETNESVPLSDGSMGRWLSYKFALRDESTGRKILAGMSVNITERERAEAALRLEREFLASILDKLQAGVVACDNHGQLTHCNRAAIALHGLSVGDPNPPLPLSSWAQYFDLLPGNAAEPLHEDASPLVSALRGEVLQDREFLVRPTNGPERILSLNATPFEDSDGHQLGAVAVIHDVTALRQARQEALRSLHEKEILLQEIHHRVKNNLQIIGSLLSMQARRTKSPDALEALRESAHRVRSIALVHEKLYGSTDLASIDASDYLRTLSRNLTETLGMELHPLNERRVSLDFELEDGHKLDASTAIACGLIVNEALTNSFKHGFPDQGTGRVTVALMELTGEPAPALRRGPAGASGPAGGWLRLEIRDNGVGVPSAAFTTAGTLNLVSKSLGMRLIQDLSEQIGGRVEFVPTDAGTGAGLTLRLTYPVSVGRLPAPEGTLRAISASSTIDEIP